MQNSASDDARNFLTEIFEPEGELLGGDARIAVWNKATHQTRLVETAEDAAQVTQDPAWRNLSYFGVCPRNVVAMRKRATETGKPLHLLQGEKPELQSMPGVWVDIDVRAPGHKKASLAPNVELALEALGAAVPLEPTIVVRTGGGIHAYWLFDEGVVEFAKSGNDRSRETMEMLCRSFQAMVRDELRKRGWSDDQTWALPRVMRIPGGQNTSHGPTPRDVTWEKVGQRYTIDGLWGVVPNDLELSEPSKVEHDDDRLRFEIREITLAVRDEVMAFIDEVCEIDEEFKKVWDRKRPSTLPSQSEMDLSIATRLAAGNTPTQRIVDALRIHRIDAGVNPKKAERADYYLGVLQLALGSTDEDRKRGTFLQKVETMRARPSSGDGSTETALAVLPPSEKKELVDEALEVVNGAFELKDNKRITRIVRETLGSGSAEDWRFFFGHLGADMIRVVKGSQLTGCHALRSEILLATGEIVRPFTTKPNKPRQWGPVVQAIFVAAQTVGAQTESAALIDSLLRYVDRVALTPGSAVARAAPFSAPWHREVESNAAAMFWKSKGGEAGVLLRLDSWVESLTYDPIGPQGNKRAAWARLLAHTDDAIENVPAVSFIVEGSDKRRNRRGYIRLRRDFFVRHGGEEMAALLDEIVEKAPSE